jgi:hypothetical protein
LANHVFRARLKEHRRAKRELRAAYLCGTETDCRGSILQIHCALDLRGVVGPMMGLMPKPGITTLLRRGHIMKSRSRLLTNRTPSTFRRFEALEPRHLMAVDVILEWNEIMLDANAVDHSLAAPEEGGPILTARAFAIVSAAMYDAYNSVASIGEKYLVKAPLAKTADVDAAVAQAAHDTLVALYPSQAETFDAALTATLARVRNGLREIQGRVVGAYVADVILDARADDGADDLGSSMYVANGLPGFHTVDPMNPNQGYYAAGAMVMKPFAVDSLDQFEARRLDDGTPEGRMEFMAGQEYADAFAEVVRLGGNGTTSPSERTPEQTNIGIYWAYDGRPGLGTPPRLYNQIAATIARQEGNTEGENARMFALLNIAMADAGFTAWNNKYDDAFWRPVMGVRYADVDGNPETEGDADWIPLGAPASNPRPEEIDFTPPFPAYTSGHATFGAAVFQSLARFYGRDDISFSFISDELNGVTLGSDGQPRSVVERSFDSLTEAKLENAQSRIYLGIHWRFDADDGIQTGDEVADYVFENFLETKRPHHGGHHEMFAFLDWMMDQLSSPKTSEPTATPLAVTTVTSSHDRVFEDLGTQNVMTSSTGDTMFLRSSTRETQSVTKLGGASRRDTRLSTSLAE